MQSQHTMTGHASLRYTALFATLLLASISFVTPAQCAEKPAHHHPARHTPTVPSGHIIDANTIPEEATHFVYLTPDSIAPNTLAKPARYKSKAWKTDITKVIQMQKYAADTEISQAQAEQKVTPELVTPVLGGGFTREKFPLTYTLLDNIVADSKAVTKQAKDFWHLPRPYVADHHVMLQVAPLAPTNFSYPSGHTSTSLVLAKTLGDMIPAAAPALLKKATEVANRRIIAGVHSPQDLTGGQQLGEAIYLQLKAQPAFQTAFAAAQNEIQESGMQGHAMGCHPQTLGKKNWKHFKSRITE